MPTPFLSVSGAWSIISIGKLQVSFGNASASCSTPKEARRVIQRLRYLRDAHQLTSAQLLRLVPPEWGWTLGTIDDDAKLMNSLGPDQFTWFSNTFHVNRNWLEGSLLEDDRYATRTLWGYKSLEELGRELSSLGWLNDKLKMSILAVDYQRGDRPLGRYSIVFSHPIGLGDQKDVYAHATFEREWTWHHQPCWLDTVTVAMWYGLLFDHVKAIPIRPVRREEFEALMEGERHPGEFFSLQVGGYDRLDDRVLTLGQKQEDDGVIAYLNESGLGQYAIAESSVVEAVR